MQHEPITLLEHGESRIRPIPYGWQAARRQSNVATGSSSGKLPGETLW